MTYETVCLVSVLFSSQCRIPNCALSENIEWGESEDKKERARTESGKANRQNGKSDGDQESQSNAIRRGEPWPPRPRRPSSRALPGQARAAARNLAPAQACQCATALVLVRLLLLAPLPLKARCRDSPPGECSVLAGRAESPLAMNMFQKTPGNMSPSLATDEDAFQSLAPSTHMFQNPKTEYSLGHCLIRLN